MGQHSNERRTEEVDVYGEEYGSRKMIKRQDPREPSKEEKEEHETTHIPFQSWCRNCVKGRGKEEACRDVKRGHELAEVHGLYVYGGRRKR